MSSQWVQHVKQFSNQHNMPYKDAMQHAQCKQSYQLSKSKRGGDIFGDISKGFKKAGKDINKGVNTATKYVKNDLGNDVKKAYGEVNQTALKQDWGGKVEMVKGMIPREVLTATLGTALMSVGVVDPNIAFALANSASGSVYAVDFSKSLKGQGKAALAGADLENALSAATSKPATTSGEGFGDIAKYGLVNKVKLNKAIKKLGGSFQGSSVGGSFKGSGHFSSPRPMMKAVKSMNGIKLNKKQINNLSFFDE